MELPDLSDLEVREPHWTEADIEDFQRAAHFSELAVVALRIVKRMPRPVCLVCGPMTTDGAGHASQHLFRFTDAIERLRKTGFTVLSQPQLEPALDEIRRSILEDAVGTMLEQFYGTLLRSGSVGALFFLPRWRDSVVAQYERDLGIQLGIPILDLLDSAGW